MSSIFVRTLTSVVDVGMMGDGRLNEKDDVGVVDDEGVVVEEGDVVVEEEESEEEEAEDASTVGEAVGVRREVLLPV